MIKKPSVYKYSWLAKLFRQVPYSYQTITLDLTEIKITRSDAAEEVSYPDISYMIITKRWWWYQVHLALSSEKKISLGGFNKRKARAIQSRFTKYKEQYHKTIKEISNTTNQIIEFFDWLQKIQEGRSWFSKHDLEAVLRKP